MDFKILLVCLVVTLHRIQSQECKCVSICNDEDKISNSAHSFNTGSSGRRGAKADRGIPGKAGPSGLKGSPGKKGNKGVHGVPGIKGASGIKGLSGEKGNHGIHGRPGIKGVAGIQGPRRKKGNIGVQGHPGMKGAAGIQGLPGEKGNQGFHGPPGMDGAVGIKGSPGTKGKQGVKGESGSIDGTAAFQQEIRNRMTDFNHSLSLLESKLNAANVIIENLFPVRCLQSDEDGSQFLRSGERVYCHQRWRVIQRRFNGQVIFHKRNWNEYKNGFGILSTEFWIGLDKIHSLTRNGRCRLRVELGAFDGSESHAEYREFSIGDESDLFRLLISGYSGGNAGDAIVRTGNNNNYNMAFTTFDRDNDRASWGNCAADREGGRGAWWHNQCGTANLNGRWGENIDTSFSFAWWKWKNAWITLKSSMMMIRCD